MQSSCLRFASGERAYMRFFAGAATGENVMGTEMARQAAWCYGLWDVRSAILDGDGAMLLVGEVALREMC